MYQLSGEALRLADHLIVIMSFVMVGMSYQMPVSAFVLNGLHNQLVFTGHVVLDERDDVPVIDGYTVD